MGAEVHEARIEPLAELPLVSSLLQAHICTSKIALTDIEKVRLIYQPLAPHALLLQMVRPRNHRRS